MIICFSSWTWMSSLKVIGTLHLFQYNSTQRPHSRNQPQHVYKYSQPLSQ
ncbi:hypothetical protein KC19_8G018200 [Ceratodon purpureus]|uniref:Uncharacterized protein n=1 Tax=Ceratodon purpureus TaxID=3225 RepID=A0A8T0GUB5_CERPU|nr:hypothetical protein KC19_8G018200 [Ceratodon purpureus]